MGSPARPVPGHCVCREAWGHSFGVVFSGAVKTAWTSVTGVIATVPSPGTHGERPR